MSFLKFFFVTLSVTLISATTNYDAISRGRKPELRQDNFETFRLPNDTRALTYDISIRTWIDEGNFTFTGTVRIGIIAEQSTNRIILHHRELLIEDVTLLSEAGDTIPIGTTSYDSEFEFFTIPVTSNLTEGSEYTIVINYRGTMQTTWSGFYAIRYRNSDGNEVYYGSTQFEATDARRAFPCYDEIGRKSLFTIRITHDPSYSAISNMPTTSANPTPNPDGSVTTEFQETPLMSTYLIAFHVSDFAHVLGTSGSVPHRIFTRPNVVNLTSRALHAGEIMLDAFSEHFGMDYVLPKMDAASLPDFGGAMENFGLITYSDYYMLFDENIDGYEKTISSVQTIAHEQAHQWFGNLVTPTWWTYTWMKEGFATLFHSFGMDLIYPEWTMKDYMLVTTVHNLFRYESFYGYDRPMTHYVEQPEEIDSIFDNISYSKAASVLRMFLLAFGEETFMAGLRLYLIEKDSFPVFGKHFQLPTDIQKIVTENHIRYFIDGSENDDNILSTKLIYSAFSDVTEENLFDAIAAVLANESEVIIPPSTNVTAIMSSWTRQAGYPFITVERNYNQQTDQVTLTQIRYFYPTLPIDPDNTTYWVPYNFATPNNPGFNSSRSTGWIPQGQVSITVTVDSLDADDYLLLDTYAGGYYRILYDPRNYRLISDAMILNPEHFHITSKAALLENVKEFFNNQQLTMAPVMDVLRTLENEVDYIAWYPIQEFILEIDELFSGHQNYDVFRDFIRNLIEELYDSVRLVDIPDEPILRKPARRLAVSLACYMGSVHCRSDALRLLREVVIASGGEFHQNIRRQMYCAALRSADFNEFNFVWNRMLESQNGNQRAELRQSLACSMSRISIIRLLSSLLPSTNENDIEYRPNEAYELFRSIYENGIYSLELTLDFVIENAVETYETFGTNGPNFLIDMAQSIRRDDLTQKFRSLLQIYLDEGLITQSTVYVVEEIIYGTRDWFEQHAAVIDQWLVTNFS